jgi:hypothetical protein
MDEMTNEMIFTIYFTGIILIALGFGAWCAISTDEISDQPWPLMIIGIWIWPILLSLGMLFGAGYWAGPKLYAAFVE